MDNLTTEELISLVLDMDESKFTKASVIEITQSLVQVLIRYQDTLDEINQTIKGCVT